MSVFRSSTVRLSTDWSLFGVDQISNEEWTCHWYRAFEREKWMPTRSSIPGGKLNRELPINRRFVSN